MQVMMWLWELVVVVEILYYVLDQPEVDFRH